MFSNVKVDNAQFLIFNKNNILYITTKLCLIRCFKDTCKQKKDTNIMNYPSLNMKFIWWVVINLVVYQQ